jgi:hypothetical protein
MKWVHLSVHQDKQLVHSLHLEQLSRLTAVRLKGESLMRGQRDQVEVNTQILSAGTHLKFGVQGDGG